MFIFYQGKKPEKNFRAEFVGGLAKILGATLGSEFSAFLAISCAAN